MGAGKKTINLSFRCDQDLHDKLRLRSFERRVSIQQSLEEGLNMLFSSAGTEQRQPPSSSFGAVDKREAAFLDEMLQFLRNAPPEAVRDVRSMAATIAKISKPTHRAARKTGSS